ncbi:glycosyl hydrolase [Caulobacter rhizosphaerae]|jgi:hypothetical protein|uniref:glycosyl hydrolase n=1 Tax=Caulobacter rhizosphaerae TaxID=2010972 RepID=UPI00199A51DC|nr:glycosyl hydrolase [Caulobacter rhizosphaerae]GGL10780.1 hypothetical protein GCM10010983_04840 [Caulobacter rhizosphaerae]
MKHGHMTRAVLGALLATTALGGVARAQSTALPGSVAPATLEAAFQNPPNSARPRAWWHWMNGNITKEGIEKDFDWMARVGLGGVTNFDVNLATPQIVQRRLAYMTPEWKDAFRFAAQSADQHGLELTIAASPGWSETGGPWVTPQNAMKKLVWSETSAVGGKRLSLVLAAPPQVTGPFQDAPFRANFAAADTGKAPAELYRDVMVLAYPAPAAAKPLPPPAFATSLGAVAEGGKLADGRLQTTVDVPLKAGEGPGYILADFGKPVTVRSVTLGRPEGGGVFDQSGARAALEAADGAGGWRKVADLPLEGVQSTISFEPVTAQRLRVVLTPVAPDPNLGGLFKGVPGAVKMAFGPSQAASVMAIGELRFFGEERLDRFEAKAGFAIAPDYYALERGGAAAGVAPDAIIDLTDRMGPDGKLDWTPPPGDWRIVRLGYSLLGTTNHPAPAEATGFEVDKYDAAAVRAYLEHYLAMYQTATGPDLIGERGVRALLTDSIEVGASNWTGDMVGRFKALRGYDPKPWLLALTGVVVGSRQQSDAFLYDFRRTLADLIAEAHYGQVAEVAHARGLAVYGESLEAGRPSLGDDLQMRQHADFPMAAIWTYDPKDGPRPGYIGDIRGAASVAHVMGQNIAAAESMTAAFSPWAFAPVDLKPIADLEFVNGINRSVIHTSVHQPVDDKQPGLSLGPFGQYFNRHETWAEMAKPWVDYLSRTSLMLQQGRYFADVAYFYGEDSPVTVLYQAKVPQNAPRRYGYDLVNGDMLLNTLKADGGALAAPSGARYKVLYLGGTSQRMTLPVLKRLAALVEGGVTVVGKAPLSSPSLADDAGAFTALVSRLWAGGAVTTVGQGRVVAGDDVEKALLDLGQAPDFEADAGGGDVQFLHRRLDDGSDVYFVSNQSDRALTLDARFRVSGRKAEIWRADTGGVAPTSYRTEGERTVVPLELSAHDALFVVFRQAADQPQVTLPTPRWAPAAQASGPWTVAFQPGRGAPATVTLASLAPLNDNPDPGVKYFSGVAAYKTTLTAPAKWRTGQPLQLDLGRVGDVAEVIVNGQSAGYAWKAPWRVDVSRALKPGKNSLEVRVANLWVNRLVGDAQPGAKPLTFTAMPTYRPDAPLRTSGLIGPVTLLAPQGR